MFVKIEVRIRFWIESNVRRRLKLFIRIGFWIAFCIRSMAGSRARMRVNKRFLIRVRARI